MNKKLRALVVDDQPVWAELFDELLDEMGFAVLMANNFQDALDIIDHEYFHLLVSDVRLIDDDETDHQGLEILAHIDALGLSDVITTIVITGYGTREWARQSFKQYKVHDFRSKQGPDGRGFDADDFKQSVNEAIEKIQINLDLQVEYVHGISRQQMLNVIQRSIKNGSPDMLQWELDDLIRKLFYDASTVVISPIEEGHSQSGVVKVEPFYKNHGQAAARILKYGTIDIIEQEYKNFQKIQRFTDTKRYTSLEEKSRTRLLGGIVYSCGCEDANPVHDVLKVDI